MTSPAQRGLSPAINDPPEGDNTPAYLRFGTELFRLLMKTMPAGAFVWDGERTVFVNDAAVRISGYTRDELVRMSPWDLVHPDSLPHLLEQYQKNLAGEPIPQQYELKMLAKSGEPRWVLLTFDWLHLTETDSLMVGTVIDITDRKASEQAVQERDARFRVLYEDNPSMYFTVDPAGVVLEVNEFGASQLGYSREELAGSQVIEIFHPEDRRAVRRQLNRLLARPGETAVWEFRKLRKDGEIIFVKEVARATCDVEGNPIVLIVCEDITEWKRMEEEIRRQREELEQKVEQKMEARGAYRLTFRELTVLHLVADGKADKEIAAVLGISPLTANKHVTNILAKMGASSRAEASARGVRERLFD